MNSIYFISPAHIATGGTELLQQACSYLKQFGASSYMYYTEELKESPVEKRFAKYSNRVAEVIPDNEDTTVVIPETRIDYINKFKRAKIYIWWLSVDNYYGAKRRKVDIAHKIIYGIKDLKNHSIFIKCSHLVQSEYARIFLINEKGVAANKIQKLSDYLNHTYMEKVVETNDMPRKNRILYNPKKGVEFTKKLIAVIPEYEWVALQNFTPDEMKMVMQTSKVYVDFGNHPGKDRIPREAAICGCCVITGRNGAAANDIDVLINSKYKFEEDDCNLEMIRNTIIDCIENFEMKAHDFDEYRSSIRHEEQVFREELKRIFLI